MRRTLLITIGLAVLALSVPAAALATTQTASAGPVTATFTFTQTGTTPSFSGMHLTISQSGSVLYDQPVHSKTCGNYCAPGATGATGSKASSVHIIDLDHTGQPNVVLDIFSGGAHCCSIAQVFTFDPATRTYAKTERNFGDYGDRIADLGHDGRHEFVTGDDAFAYAFTDYAASGLPLQILTFSGGRFRDVTTHYPALIRKDAAIWLKAYKGMARQHYADSVGVIAAWAADEYQLGRRAAANRYLAQQAGAGHLKSPLGRSVAQGQRFVTVLKRFLRRHGY